MKCCKWAYKCFFFFQFPYIFYLPSLRVVNLYLLSEGLQSLGIIWKISILGLGLVGTAWIGRLLFLSYPSKITSGIQWDCSGSWLLFVSTSFIFLSSIQQAWMFITSIEILLNLFVLFFFFLCRVGSELTQKCEDGEFTWYRKIWTEGKNRWKWTLYHNNYIVRLNFNASIFFSVFIMSWIF